MTPGDAKKLKKMECIRGIQKYLEKIIIWTEELNRFEYPKDLEVRRKRDISELRGTLINFGSLLEHFKQDVRMDKEMEEKTPP